MPLTTTYDTGQGTFAAVADLLDRGRRMSLRDYTRELLAHAPLVRTMAARLRRIERAAALRPSLAARHVGMGEDLQRALDLIDRATDSPRLRFIPGIPMDRASREAAREQATASSDDHPTLSNAVSIA